jgi:hypothetical protein
MAFNLCMSFIDYPWRFATVPPAEIQLRLYQALAHGAGPAFNMHGTPDQEDRSAYLAAQHVFRWHAEHQGFYVGQRNAARVLLLGGAQASYRGFFRLLSERHIPFAVSDNLKLLDNASPKFDLVIAPDNVPEELEAYLRGGGRVLAAGLNPPSFGVPRALGVHARTQGYWRVRDHGRFPSLARTNLLFLDGGYVQLERLETPILTLIPPAMFGPPEKVWADKSETNIPGLVVSDVGNGRLAYLPWDIGALYYRHSSPAHAGLLVDLVDHLLAEGRQLRTNAHPLVEITLMNQSREGRTLVHLVNLSGHSGTAYFSPVEMRDIRVEVRHDFSRARSVSLEKPLEVVRDGPCGSVILPLLNAYDVVVLE